MQAEFRKLPGIEAWLQTEAMATLAKIHSQPLVVDAARLALAAARQAIVAGQPAPSLEALTQAVSARISTATRPSLQAVINATGVIIHTNLGRALLSERAKLAMQEAASAYSNLEYQLEAGERGSRYNHAAELLCKLTGAEAALVVNNNAGALVLVLTALARGAEVIISRSQLVEIGGGFRIPDIMIQSGCKLVEVGTTNRTYSRDYEEAIDPAQTGLLLAVHASNYKISGFTTQPTLAELAELARRHNLPLFEDLGSGTLLDTTPFGLAHEPTIQESLASGVDIVTASGDKLLGGPQAGLILGRRDLIEQLKKHPLLRAFRVDKLTLAALQATLLAYLEDRALTEIPVWRMIALNTGTLQRRARRWRTALLAEPALAHVPMLLVDTVSTIGGGSLPGQTLPTRALALEVPSADGLHERLRQPGACPPVIARIENNRLLLDARTVLPEQDKLLIDALKAALLDNEKR
jgi:L-seryl-tRNA(Ser) seleniumtransferase